MKKKRTLAEATPTSGVDVDTTVSLAGEGGTGGVNDTHTQRPAFKAVPQCEDGVRGLPDLAQERGGWCSGTLLWEEEKGEDGGLG